jgi:putative ABC transport system ATP-binding protein
LDSENAIALLDLLRTASGERGKTVLLVGHDPHAAQVADATVEMADGHAVSAPREPFDGDQAGAPPVWMA